jgi:putative hemolysin
MQDLAGELLLIVLLILINAFFAASEIAVVSVRKARLRQLADEGVKEAAMVERLAEDASRFLATIQVGVTLVSFFMAATAAISLADPVQRLILLLPLPTSPDAAHSLAVTLITIIVAFVMLLFGELVPKTLALQHAERVSLAVVRPITFLSRLLAPAIGLITLLSDVVTGPFGGKGKSSLPFITPDEIKSMVDAGQEGGVIQTAEKEMIYSIFDMSETPVREVMVPRIDIFALSVETPIPEVIAAALRTTHTRIPVYEGTKDNMVGLIHTKDLLKCGLESCPVGGLRDLLRPIHFVPESKKVDDLLREMQTHNLHMAAVLDEYGGTAGLVTIEDLLEEIVGEIRDEYDDKEESLVQSLGEGEAIFQGVTPLDDVNETLDLDLTAEDVDSIGGYVYTQLGRIPVPGDTVTTQGAALTVLATTGRRVKKVKVTKQGTREDSNDTV